MKGIPSFGGRFAKAGFYAEMLYPQNQALHPTAVEHNENQERYKEAVQEKPQIIEPHIISQITGQPVFPEKEDSRAQEGQNQFIKKGGRHQGKGAAAQGKAILFHGKQLGRLSARGGGRDAGKEEPDKRIGKTAQKGGAVFRKPEKLPNHKPFHAYEKNSGSGSAEKIKGIQFAHGRNDIPQIIFGKNCIKGQQHNKKKECGF